MKSQTFSETLTTSFSDVVKNSGITQYEELIVDTSDISDLLLEAIAKYKNHPTVRFIKNTFKNLSTFKFHHVDERDIEKEVMNLNNSKASQDSDIPVKNH